METRGGRGKTKGREVPAIWAEGDEEEAKGALLLAWQNEGFPPFVAPPPPPRQRKDEEGGRGKGSGRSQTAPHQTSRQERKGEIKQ